MFPMFGRGIGTEGRMLIDNIISSFKSSPVYSSYVVEKDTMSYSDAGAIAIKVSKNGMPVNMFLFYPNPRNGKLGSCAIYGSSLQGHYNAINNSKMMFGLPVESVSMDCGAEQFVDVTFSNF